MSGAGDLAALAASTFDQRWYFDPVEASAQGLSAHDHRLGDFGERRVRQHVAGLTAMTHALEALDLEDLHDEIDRTALLNDLRVQIHTWSVERPHVRDPGLWLNHLLEGLYHLLAARDRDAHHRRDAIRARLEAAPGLLDGARATLAGCPRPFLETAAQMVVGGRQLICEAAALAPPDHEPMARARDGALAALDRLEAHLAGNLTERAGEDFAVGPDAFNYRLAFQHALRTTTPQVLRYGAALIEEVTHDLERAARALSPGEAWPDLLDRLRADHAPAAEVVAAYRAAMERARAFAVERGLVTVVDGDLEVVATPSFLVPMIPFAAYQPPGAYAAVRTGRFYVTEALDTTLREYSRWEIPVTALHEGWPGHHLQFVVAVGLERRVRRIIATPVTVEGWALYCEEMMAEEGFLAAAEERFFQRVALLWRALRVVLDAGLHTQGVTREQAVDLLVDRLHMDRPHAEAEVRRYTAAPTYQLAYAIGRNELKGLRADYQRAAGSGFELRAFHDRVLAFGGLPVSLIRWGLQLDG